jgi:putative transposase
MPEFSQTERKGGQDLQKQRREAVFDHIGRFYNARRRYSTIGYVSPMEFERRTGFA